MAALGLEGRCTVWKDEYGHLQIEVEGPGAEQLARAEEVETLSALLETPLRSAEESGGMAHLVQKEPLRAVAGVAAADREGQSVSGDAGAWFKDDSGKLNVVLCDGMGSGPEAREDSDCALSLLEKFLRAGLTPEETLSTVGEALALRGEAQGGFTTVDLLQLDLYTGRGAVYKLGAAPTYLKKGTAVERLEGAALPAGVTMESGEPDRFVLKLEAGDCVVMVSDGVTSGRDDDWLKELVGSFDGLSPRVLADCILQESGRREGRGDDRTVMVLKVEQRR
jgi:serine phosphatase RsbU (regulator of sigma subunit)